MSSEQIITSTVESCLHEQVTLSAGICETAASLEAESHTAVFDDKTFELLRHSDVILVDTCVLMSPGFATCLQRNADALRSNGIVFSFTPQVFTEVFRKMREGGTVDVRQRARSAWFLLTAPEFADLFNTYPPDAETYQADQNIIDAVRNLVFRQHRNVLVLTEDKGLTADIFNVCCAGLPAGREYGVHVLYVDSATGMLMRYHTSRLENLSYDIEIPTWHRLGAAKVFNRQERYMRRAFDNATVYMDATALHAAFPRGRKQPFVQNLQRLAALRGDQRINVLSTELTDRYLRSKVEALPQLFRIVPPYAVEMTGSEALFHSIYGAAAAPKHGRVLVLTNDPERAEHIANRIPTCHRSRKLWFCRISDEGMTENVTNGQSADCDTAA